MIRQRIAFHTFGCKVNYTETSSIQKLFETDDNYEIVGFKEDADIYVINSCAVTSNAEKKCNFLIKQTQRLHNEKIIFLLGCYVEKDYETLKHKFPNVYILNNTNKFQLKEYLQNIQLYKNYHIPQSSQSEYMQATYSAGERTRSFVKIQDGCDFFCSYCIIPYLRGKCRSANIDEIIDNVKDIAKQNVKEIVLTGINIGKYGLDNNQSFLSLLQELENIEGIQRIRISSIEPNLIDEQLIRFFANSKKYLPHFHIPLQSGSDKILKLMNRKYDTHFYQERINYLIQSIPNAFIGTDVIVGFPEETADDFEQICQYIQKLPISFVHVFTYSERSGTKAIDLPNKVTDKEKKRRSEILHNISHNKLSNFYKSFKGKEFNVLFESDVNEGMISGFTENYIKVKTKYNVDYVNQIIPVELKIFDDNENAYIFLQT